jgi:hypothetical protein
MGFLPWTIFMRLIKRYGGDRYITLLICNEQLRTTAFARLNCRDSLQHQDTLPDAGS